MAAKKDGPTLVHNPLHVPAQGPLLHVSHVVAGMTLTGQGRLVAEDLRGRLSVIIRVLDHGHQCGESVIVYRHDEDLPATREVELVIELVVRGREVTQFVQVGPERGHSHLAQGHDLCRTRHTRDIQGAGAPGRGLAVGEGEALAGMISEIVGQGLLWGKSSISSCRTAFVTYIPFLCFSIMKSEL